MKKRWIVFGAVLLVAAPAVYLGTRPQKSAVPLDAALRVDVKRDDLVIEVVDSGKVEPLQKIEIKSKIAGQVAEVLVAEGQAVKKGDLLLRLDPIDSERDVARAAADVAQAKNALDFAELDHARKKRMVADHLVAAYELELATNTREAKKIALVTAELSATAARDRLRSTRIESPIDGTVLELGIKTGEVVTPGVQQTFEGRPLLVIGDLSTLLVRAELNQIDIAKIRLDQAVVLTFDALHGERFDARVTKTAPSAIRPKGKEIDVFPVEATLTTRSPTIRPGMTADLRFRIDVKLAVLAVPIEAVVKEGEKSFVSKIVLAQGKEEIERVAVELGTRNDRQYEVTRGLTEGEHLLIDPASSKAHEVDL